jgi:hypothetical protein
MQIWHGVVSSYFRPEIAHNAFASSPPPITSPRSTCYDSIRLQVCLFTQTIFDRANAKQSFSDVTAGGEAEGYLPITP